MGRRLVLVVEWPVLGGAERHALGVARELLETGAALEVVALTKEDGRFKDKIVSLGIPWHAWPIDWAGGRVARLAALSRFSLRLRGLRPEALVSYCKRPNVFCGLVWRATGASTCVWNQRDVIGWTQMNRALVRRAALGASVQIANSRTARDFLVRELDLPPERIRIVLNGVDGVRPRRDRDEWRSVFGIPPEALVVTMAAHFTHRKDHATLMRAWQRVCDISDRSVVLVLAGRSGGTEAAAKALAFDLGLEAASVRFLGDVEDMPGLLEASDVAVLSSRSESYPNALLESMAAGLPVAGTDIPGIREVVGEHELRFLAPPGDHEALARALHELLSSRGLREQLGTQNASLVSMRNRRSAATLAVEVISGALHESNPSALPSAR